MEDEDNMSNGDKLVVGTIIGGVLAILGAVG